MKHTSTRNGSFTLITLSLPDLSTANAVPQQGQKTLMTERVCSVIADWQLLLHDTKLLAMSGQNVFVTVCCMVPKASKLDKVALAVLVSTFSPFLPFFGWLRLLRFLAAFLRLGC